VTLLPGSVSVMTATLDDVTNRFATGRLPSDTGNVRNADTYISVLPEVARAPRRRSPR
jgi:hypothetical protein